MKRDRQVAERRGDYTVIRGMARNRTGCADGVRSVAWKPRAEILHQPPGVLPSPEGMDRCTADFGTVSVMERELSMTKISS